MRFRHIPLMMLLVAGLVRPAWAEGLRLLTHPLAPFTTGDANTAGGLGVEVVRGMMKQVGADLPITIEPFARVLQSVQAGPSTLGFIVARTPEREATMQWVGPIVSTGVYLYKKAGSAVHINGLDDARALARIGVLRGNADEKFLTEQGFKNLDVSDNQLLDVKKLALGRIDATPASELVFATAVKDAGLKPSDFERTPVKFYDSAVYLAASPDVPKATVAAWQAALDTMKASGAYAAILAKYIGE